MSTLVIVAPVARFMLPVEVHSCAQSVRQTGTRLPAYQSPNLADIRVEIAGFLRLALAREGRVLPAAAAGDINHRIRKLDEIGRLINADVQHLADGFGFQRAHHDRFNCVVDIQEVAQDSAIAENLDRLVINRQPHKPVNHAIARVLHLGARTVGVGQPQQDRRDAMYVIVDLDDFFRGQIGDLVNTLGKRGLPLR